MKFNFARLILGIRYSKVGTYHNNVAAAMCKKYDSFVLINKFGRKLCPPIYSQIVYIGKGLWKAQLNNKDSWLIMDSRANVLSDCLYEKINAFDGDFVFVKPFDATYYYLYYDGNKLSEFKQNP